MRGPTGRNWQRYEQPGVGLTFEEGVDRLRPYAGDLNEGLALTIAKLEDHGVLRRTGLRQFHDGARLTLVSEQSFQEAHASINIHSTPNRLELTPIDGSQRPLRHTNYNLSHR